MKSFDWNLFWNAFGAIGATVGSLATALTVFIAIKQLQQPKEIKIRNKEFVKMKISLNQNPIFHIRYFNDCLRTVFIESVGYYIDDQYIGLTSEDAKINLVGSKDNQTFPCVLTENAFLDISIEYGILKQKIKCYLKENKKDVNSKISFGYEDAYIIQHKLESLSIKDFFRIYDKIYESQ